MTRSRLPADNILHAEYAALLSVALVAARYGVTESTMRHTLARIGALQPVRVGEPPMLIDAGRPDRITVSRLVSSPEYGGLARRPFSLPRISMHVAQLKERRS